MGPEPAWRLVPDVRDSQQVPTGRVGKMFNESVGGVEC